jgi:hypothetical protein
MVGEIKPTSSARSDISKQTIPQTDIGSFKDVISLACKHEDEQRSKIESFLEYFVTPRTKYLVTWKNILPHVIDE